MGYSFYRIQAWRIGVRLGLLLVGADMRVGDMVNIAQQAERAHFTTMAIAEAWRSAWVTMIQS